MNEIGKQKHSGRKRQIVIARVNDIYVKRERERGWAYFFLTPGNITND